MEDLADDLLVGTKEIARFTGETPRRVFYLLEKRMIPGFKVGFKWYGRKSRLRDHYASLEKAGQTAA